MADLASSQHAAVTYLSTKKVIATALHNSIEPTVKTNAFKISALSHSFKVRMEHAANAHQIQRKLMIKLAANVIGDRSLSMIIMAPNS